MRIVTGARALLVAAVIAPALFGAGVASAATRSHASDKISKHIIGKATAPGLPPVKNDSIQVQFDSSVTVDEATLWLDYVIAVRQSALSDAKTEVQSLKHVSSSDQQQLLTTLQQVGTSLNLITNNAPSNPALPEITREAQSILGLQIFGVIAPQYSLLQKEDQLLTWTDTLSNKEAAAAAAIAIMQLSTSISSLEPGLDAAIQSIVQRALSTLNQSKSAILGVTASDTKTADSMFTSANSVVTGISAQLKLAESDLRQLVGLLAGS